MFRVLIRENYRGIPPRNTRLTLTHAGADPGFFLEGGALVSRSTSTPINHIFFFFWQKTAGHLRGEGGAHPLHPPPRSAPDTVTMRQ